MKKIIIIMGAMCLFLAASTQEIRQEAISVNVEVPLRAFNGDKFVDDLTIEDIEVYEDGILQKIEALYLIKKAAVRRKEEEKKFSPETLRNFYLFFEIAEYTPKLKDALSYFFENVLLPEDRLTIITPMNTYRLKGGSSPMLPNDKIVSQLTNILRKDALQGNSEYRSVVRELKTLARSLSTALGETNVSEFKTYDGFEPTIFAERPLDELINIYASLLDSLESLRRVDEKKLLHFAEYLREEKGQKHVFLFYEREFIPQVPSRILDQCLSLYQDRPDIVHDLTYLFEFMKRDFSFDIERLKRAYSDSSIAVHFLFFIQPRQQEFDVEMREHSEDVFKVFNEIAQATGGTVNGSANPSYLFQRAAEASENYYLVYYAPKDYKADGKYKNIKVRIKNKDYKVIHRAGYVAS